MKDTCRSRLRDLAGRYAEFALSDTMARRREKWRLHNGLKERTFPFHIEDNGSFIRDLRPPLVCEDEDGRRLEARLLAAITACERIDDDRILPDRFVVDWETDVDSFCDELRFTHADDGSGRSYGYKTNKPIRDIDGDFGKLRKRTATLNRPLSEKRFELAQDAFRGLLPVDLGRCSSFYSDGITIKAVHLLGMQELYMQMADSPESVHRLLNFLAEDNADLGHWEEEHGLLRLNNDGNQGYCSGTSLFTDEIPGREIKEGERILSADRYGYLNAQEAVGISPPMFKEFLLPHFQKLSAKFKLLKFGCCEPVHPVISHLQSLHGLRKVSVSPWCDQKALAERCDRDVIWSRKPAPLILCGATFNPDALRAHLAETLDAGAGHFIEFIFRDTTRLTGEMEGRVNETCRIVREISGHHEGARR